VPFASATQFNWPSSRTTPQLRPHTLIQPISSTPINNHVLPFLFKENKTETKRGY
jgi:hypothetical protein